MFCLYGVKEEHGAYCSCGTYGISCSDFRQPTYTLVAKFDNRRDADKYVKWAKLKTYEICCGGKCDKQFRKKSVLAGYCGAEIEEEVIVQPVPINLTVPINQKAK